MSELEVLRRYVGGLRTGRLSDADELESLLCACWGELDGGSAEGTKAEKLAGRVEDLEWDPPLLRFKIERHGRTVRGSSRADMHAWSVDVDAGTASCSPGGWRQLKPAAARLDVVPLAREVAEVVSRGAEDEWLLWRSPADVEVRVGLIVPADGVAKQTVEGRRKRLKLALDEALRPGGWRRAGPRPRYRRGDGPPRP